MTRIELFRIIACKMVKNWSSYSPKCTCKQPKKFLKSMPKSVDFRLVKCCKTQSDYCPKCMGKQSYIYTNPVLNPCHKLTCINVDVHAYSVQFSFRDAFI